MSATLHIDTSPTEIVGYTVTIIKCCSANYGVISNSNIADMIAATVSMVKAENIFNPLPNVIRQMAIRILSSALRNASIDLPNPIFATVIRGVVHSMFQPTVPAPCAQLYPPVPTWAVEVDYFSNGRKWRNASVCALFAASDAEKEEEEAKEEKEEEEEEEKELDLATPRTALSTPADLDLDRPWSMALQEAKLRRVPSSLLAHYAYDDAVSEVASISECCDSGCDAGPSGSESETEEEEEVRTPPHSPSPKTIAIAASEEKRQRQVELYLAACKRTPTSPGRPLPPTPRNSSPTTPTKLKRSATLKYAKTSLVDVVCPLKKLEVSIEEEDWVAEFEGMRF